MNKKVLAIYFSQTGQLEKIIDNFILPLTAAGIHVEKVSIKPANEYPFPWTGKSFYDVMPDSVLGVPVPLVPFTLQETTYDLIILGYQSWFLSPSIPATSLLQLPSFQKILRDTPVVTITGARNMWLNAFVGIKKLLKVSDAKHVGNIAMVDRHWNPVSYFTIFHWMLGGKKTRLLNFFPLPGVSEEDIVGTQKFGETVLPHLVSGNWNGMQDTLEKHDAVAYQYSLMLLEAKAGPQYIGWAKKVNNSKNREGVLTVFKYFLHVALFIGAPVILIVDGFLIKPFSSKKIRALKQYYLSLI